MNKEVYLIRHAKSSWQHAGEVADVNRPLAIKGVQDALKMSERLAHSSVKFDKIYSSHGIRALHTAVMFTQSMVQDPRRIAICNDLYLPLKSNILDVIQSAKKEERVIALFTHDPGITDFAFSTEAKLEHVATSGIVHFELKIDDWSEAAIKKMKFQSYDFPKNHLT